MSEVLFCVKLLFVYHIGITPAAPCSVTSRIVFSQSGRGIQEVGIFNRQLMKLSFLMVTHVIAVKM